MISLKNAPRFLYVVNALQTMLFILPVIMLFYGYKGVSIGDFFLIQGLASLFVFLLEVPSGYIGDIFSRKATIIGGLIFWIGGYLAWIFGSGFCFVLIGELIFSLAISTLSGTTEAYLYDLLKKREKAGSFHKKMAKLSTFSNLGLLIATLTGAFIYQFMGPEATIWISIGALVLAIGIMVFLPDVPEAKRTVAADKSKWRDIVDISKYAVKHQELKWLMIFPAFYGTLTLILMWGLQSVMIVTKLPVFVFSLVLGANAFGRTIWSAFSGKIFERYGVRKIVRFLCVMIMVSILSAVVSVYMPTLLVYVCLGCMILGSGSIQLVSITTSTLMNHRIKSDERSTILSVKSMAERIMYAGALMGLKPLFDTIGVSNAFLVSAILLVPIWFSALQLIKISKTTMKE